uniref:Uncharacterized protein n=1 Tax=Oryza glumipatula TaxID=40148 RepID=A0A0D9YUB2_9ORYZ
MQITPRTELMRGICTSSTQPSLYSTMYGLLRLAIRDICAANSKQSIKIKSSNQTICPVLPNIQSDATANNSWVQHVCSSVGNEQELTRVSVWFTSWYAVRWNLSFCLDSRIFFITYLHHHRAKKEQKHQGSLKKTKEEEERGAEEGGEPLALALVDDEVCGAVGAPADLLHHLVLLHGSGSGSGSGSAPRPGGLNCPCRYLYLETNRV